MIFINNPTHKDKQIKTQQTQNEELNIENAKSRNLFDLQVQYAYPHRLDVTCSRKKTRVHHCCLFVLGLPFYFNGSVHMHIYLFLPTKHI